MAARNRLPPWHQELRLTNGREVLIRPIRPDDALPLEVPAGQPMFTTGQLFGSANEIAIVHQGQTYRLRITRQGKLVLNK